MKILNYGSLNIDHVYKVSHMVRPGETILGEDVNDYAGGKGANQSVALAKAGAKIWHGGKIGQDGQWLLQTLNDAGVNTEFTRQYEGATGHTIIQVTPEGENSIILYGGGNQQIQKEEVSEALSHFEPGDYLVLQNEINLIPWIIETAHLKGLKICVNPAPMNESVKAWPLELVDILVVNEIEAETLSAINGSFEEILDSLTVLYPNTEIVLTVGSKGAYFGKNSQREYVPVVKTKVVDTTAAGDTFLGYFLASRISGLDVPKAMERATFASSITVSRPGAMDSIPLARELNQEN